MVDAGDLSTESEPGGVGETQESGAERRIEHNEFCKISTSAFRIATPLDHLDRDIDRRWQMLNRFDAPVIGVVFNALKEVSGAYYHYGYQEVQSERDKNTSKAVPVEAQM